ncbi:hypothetical protein [Denitrificimonas caeni]|uniref:Uncharacterized protein n=1 Tax=Denitrificimonas caeni TaxID=521720 RepID=A0AAE9VSN6_9GAMM|nr:hypothetical protein [Denitrificimonas caeni]WBE25670.1 hypothetical protein O6P33_02160 [Denitrificimonas caeni]
MPKENRLQSGAISQPLPSPAPYEWAMPAAALSFKDPSARAGTGNE